MTDLHKPHIGFDVEQMSSKNKGKICKAQVVSTTRGGTT
jgi:hypothetical protein